MFLHRNASALLFSIILLGLFTVLALVFMERIVPFSQNVSGVERTNMAYYAMITAVEKTMGTIEDGKKPWTLTPQKFGDIWATFTGYTTSVVTGGVTIPQPWYGNSDYDPSKEWNLISQNQAVQLFIGNDISMDATITFRIPDLNWDWNNTTSDGQLESASWYISVKMVGSGQNFDTDKANLINWGKINAPSQDVTFSTIRWKDWSVTSGDPEKNMVEFYEDRKDTCINFACTLKFSVIETLRDVPSNKYIPYLEYKITWLVSAIPLQFTTMNVQGTIYGYSRFRSIPILQLTTQAALDNALTQ